MENNIQLNTEIISLLQEKFSTYDELIEYNPEALIKEFAKYDNEVILQHIETLKSNSILCNSVLNRCNIKDINKAKVNDETKALEISAKDLVVERSNLYYAKNDAGSVIDDDIELLKNFTSELKTIVESKEIVGFSTLELQMIIYAGSLSSKEIKTIKDMSMENVKTQIKNWEKALRDFNKNLKTIDKMVTKELIKNPENFDMAYIDSELYEELSKELISIELDSELYEDLQNKLLEKNCLILDQKNAIDFFRKKIECELNFTESDFVNFSAIEKIAKLAKFLDESNIESDDPEYFVLGRNKAGNFTIGWARIKNFNEYLKLSKEFLIETLDINYDEEINNGIDFNNFQLDGEFLPRETVINYAEVDIDYMPHEYQENWNNYVHMKALIYQYYGDLTNYDCEQNKYVLSNENNLHTCLQIMAPEDYALYSTFYVDVDGFEERFIDHSSLAQSKEELQELLSKELHGNGCGDRWLIKDITKFELNKHCDVETIINKIGTKFNKLSSSRNCTR